MGLWRTEASCVVQALHLQAVATFGTAVNEGEGDATSSLSTVS